MNEDKNYYMEEQIGDSGIANTRNPLYLSKEYQPFSAGPRNVNIGQYFNNDSKYDETLGDVQSAIEEGLIVDDLRAQQQSGWEMAGSTLVNNLVIAGTTAVLGSIGLIGGLIQSVIDADVSKIWDNPVTNAEEEIQQYVREALPIYRGKNYQDKSILGKLGTGIFWADLFENLGYTEGMLVPGAGVSTLLKRAPKIAKKVIPSIIGAVIEASTEAISSKKDEVDNKTAIATQQYNELAKQAESPFALGILENEYKETLHDINEDARKAGNFVFGSNIALLTLTNTIEFGNLFSRGFGTAKRLNGALKRTGSKYAADSMPWAMTKAGSKKLVDAFSEGMEEVSQAAITNTPQNYTDYNTFNESMFNPDKRELVSNLWSAFGKSYAETLQDKETATEFMSGFLIGALGVPMVRKSKVPITLENNMFKELYDTYKQTKESQNLADKINERLQDDKKINSYYNGLVRHLAIQDRMNTALDSDDAYDYKTAEAAQLISDIMMFDKAGDIKYLKELVNNSVDLSDEGIKAIIEETSKDGEGPFMQEGNPMDTESVRQILQERIGILNDKIDRYSKDKQALEQRYPDMDEETLSNAMFLKQQFNDHLNRYNTLLDEVTEGVNKLTSSIELEGEDVESTKKKVPVLSKSAIALAVSTGDAKLKKSLHDVVEFEESTMPFDEREELKSKLNDLEKVATNLKTINNSLKDVLSNKDKSKKDLDKIKEEKVKEDIDSKSKSLREKLSSSKDLNEFRDIINSEEDTTIKQETLDSLEEEGNELAKNYKDINAYNAAVSRAINSSDASNTAKEDALKLLQNQFRNSSNLEEMSNMNSIYITNENALYDDSLSNDENILKHQEAQHLLQSAMEAANKSKKFKDRFSKVVEVEKKETEEKSEEPKEPERKETTGSGKVSTVPTVTVSTTSKKPVTPIGDITTEDLTNENNETNESQPNLTDDSKKGNKQYYRPVIPELHIEAVKEGDFRPFSEVVAEKEGKDFSTIYNYLRDKGAFEYVNSGKLKQGDTIKFMVDPVLEEAMKAQLGDKYVGPTILMVTESNQVVGSIDSTPYSVNKFIGLGKLREDITNEYNKADKSKPFIATPTTSVSKIMIGKIPYSNQERSLKDIPGIGEKPILGVIQSGTIQVNDTKLDKSKITNPQNTLNKEGRLYLLIPNAAGKYSPVAVRVKHFNSTEFNPEDVNVSSTEIYKQIDAAITTLAQVTDEDKLKEAVSKLSKVLYTGTLHIDLVTNKSGDVLIKISKVELDKFGREIYDSKDGKKVRREKTSFIKIATDPTKDSSYIGSIGGEPKIEYVDVATIKSNITEILLDANLPIQVNKEQLGNTKYVQNLIQSNVLTSNILEAAVKGSWFTTNYIENGEEKKAINPTYIPTTTSRTTPVGGVESVIPGTKISLGGTQYSVDRINRKIYNNEGKEVNPTDKQLLLDLAYAQDEYGNKENGSNMWNNKILLPTGKVLDRTTQRYLLGKEAEEVISHINAEIKKAEDKKKHSNNTLEEIKNNQSRVDKERTDSENYYILEEDGEYHPYQRVHTRLGNNWVQTPGQTEALKDIRDKLMKLSGTPIEYNNYLDFISNKYKIVLDNFKDKTDAKSRDAIVNLVRDKMSNTNSTRALNAGTAVDTVIRNFFISNDPPVKPDNMSDEAFKQLIDSLTEIRSNIEARGERFLTNNIVLFNKYPDGTRVAGEVDILSIDKDGNFRIYDVKTSKYSFYTFKDYQGNEVNYFKNKSNSQKMSSEQYYTLQLSAYKSLFEAQYGDKVISLAILPFVLSYNGDNVTRITKEKGIPVTYDKSVQHTLGSTIKPEPVVSTKAESVNNTLPIFNSALEIQNPINRVLPNYELEDSKVGYYELNGKLYKGYLSPIGKINGYEVYMTKEPVLSRGFNKKNKEYVALNKYIAVFPNGQAVEIISNSKNSDVESNIKTLMRISIEKNPQRVIDEASKTTTISKSIISTSSSTLSGAAKTIQVEKAIDKSDAKYEDDLDLDRLVKKDKESEKIWNQEKELNWLDKVLPQLSREDRVKIAKGLIKVGNQGAVAWGQFSKGMITLSDIAAEGTTYHEAFHVVFNLLLDQKERQALYEEARQIYGNKDNLSLEEEMAEGFREYVMSRDTDNLLTKIKNFFKDLWIKVTNWNKLQPSLLSIYQRINEGKYASMELSNNEDNTRYRKLPSIKELREQAKTQYEQYSVDMEEYYRYAQGIIKELNNRRYNTQYEAKEAFDRSGIDPALFYRITKLGANNAAGYKIQLLTRDLFEEYKKNNNPAIIDDIYDSINNKPEEFLFNTLDPETQMSLLNKGWSEEQWNNGISQEERDQALRCLSL